MAKPLVPKHYALAAPRENRVVSYLSENQANALTQSFQSWYDQARENLSASRWKIRGRHWLTFLVLRYTGARLGEVIGTEDKTHPGLNDLGDIDFRQGEVRLVTLKRGQKKRPVRVVAVPLNVTSGVSCFWGHYPEMKGKIFRMTPMAFRKVFYERAREACIPSELAYPRHWVGPR